MSTKNARVLVEVRGGVAYTESEGAVDVLVVDYDGDGDPPSVGCYPADMEQHDVAHVVEMFKEHWEE